MDSKNDLDVKNLVIFPSKVEYRLQAIFKQFKGLTQFSRATIIKSGLQVITRDDLRGLHQWEELNLSGNTELDS